MTSMNMNSQAFCTRSDWMSYFMGREQISFKKWDSPQGKGCSWARAWGSHARAVATEGKKQLLRFGPQSRKRTAETFLSLLRSKASEPTAGTYRDCHKISSAWLHTHTGWLQWMVHTGTRVNTEFLEKREEEEGWGEPTVTFFFLNLLESKIIFTENMVGYYRRKEIDAICLLVIPWTEEQHQGHRALISLQRSC